MREIIERFNPTDRGTQRLVEEGPPSVAQVEEPLAELPIQLEGLERTSPVTIMPHRNSDLANVGATKWLATQIPEFGGGEADNVKTWIKRVDKVALIHGVSDPMILLAASSKLVKNAKQWYDMQDGPSNESWINLKQELLKMFDRKIPFFKAMQRIETRKWQSNRETFDQYVLAKLALIHGLDLPPRDVIHLLNRQLK